MLCKLEIEMGVCVYIDLLEVEVPVRAAGVFGFLVLFIPLTLQFLFQPNDGGLCTPSKSSSMLCRVGGLSLYC